MSDKFRINCKSVFLTYPKCELSKDQLMSNLNTLKHSFYYSICCIEQHQDGTPHLHCVLKFNKKVDIRNQNYFDVAGYHPNIQTTKNINASINYIKKDGDFLESGSLDDPEYIPKRLLPEYEEVYSFLDSLLLGYE